MTKEEYEHLLTKPDIPMECWFEFFLEKGGARIDFGLFTNLFIILTKDGDIPVSGSDGALKWVSLRSASNKFHEHYQQKFYS